MSISLLFIITNIFNKTRNKNLDKLLIINRILGVRELMGLEGLGKIDAIITTDDFSDKVVTAYQEGRENDVAMDITDGILEKIKKDKKIEPLNKFEKCCLENKIDPYLQTK